MVPFIEMGQSEGGRQIKGYVDGRSPGGLQYIPVEGVKAGSKYKRTT